MHFVQYIFVIHRAVYIQNLMPLLLLSLLWPVWISHTQANENTSEVLSILNDSHSANTGERQGAATSLSSYESKPTLQSSTRQSDSERGITSPQAQENDDYKFNIHIANNCRECNSAGTELCTHQRYPDKCQCKPAYMGIRCDVPRNPCETGYKNKPGKVYCGEGTMGVCVPVIGSAKYNCDCYQYYEDDPTTNVIDCNLATHKMTSSELYLAKNKYWILIFLLVALIIVLGFINLCWCIIRANRRNEEERLAATRAIDEEYEMLLQSHRCALSPGSPAYDGSGKPPSPRRYSF